MAKPFNADSQQKLADNRSPIHIQTSSSQRLQAQVAKAQRAQQQHNRRNHLIRQLNELLSKQLIANNEFHRARNLIDTEGLPAIEKWEKVVQERFNTKKTPITTKICAEMTEQEQEDTKRSGIVYSPRAIIMATMPRSKPKSLEFKRSSGDYTLLMHVPNALNEATGISLPYGAAPRLIFLWLATEIKRVGEPIVSLGSSRSEFMRQVGMTPRTGKRGNMKAFEQQLRNLLGTTFSAWRNQGNATTGALQLHHRFVAKDSNLWWDHDNTTKFTANLTLDNEFYQEMLSGGIPVDLNTVHALADNSMALDIYVWLTYRFSSITQSRTLPWEWLFNQFGAGEYQDTKFGLKNFRQFFLKNLTLVMTHYQNANVTSVRGGLTLHPSTPHISLNTSSQ